MQCKNHFEAKCREKSNKKDKSHKSWKCDKCGHFKKRVNYVKYDHDDSNDTRMDNLTDEVQSLFYHYFSGKTSYLYFLMG